MSETQPLESVILGGRVRLAQPYGRAVGLRATTDSVLVAAACRARPGELVADFGAGVGAVGLCIAARAPGVRLMFVEVDDDLLALSLSNATLNDVAAEGTSCDVRAHRGGRYDHVVMNPPYYERGTHTPATAPARGRALMQTEGAQIEDWVVAAARNLAPRGSVTIIHRPDALGDILAALAACKFGAVEIIPIYPFAGQPAHRVIIRARTGRRTGPVMLPPLVLHEAAGVMTAASEALLRHARPLAPE